MANRKLTTGILSRDSASFNVHVDVGNFDQKTDRHVTVEIFDWGVDQMWDNPQPVSVEPSGPIKIGPHSLRSFLAVIYQSTTQPTFILSHYEVRVSISDIRNVVINCFALDVKGKIRQGNTVRHKDLVEIT